MKRTNPQPANRREAITIDDQTLTGLNLYDSAGRLSPGECLELTNVDIYAPGYARARKKLFDIGSGIKDIGYVRNHIFWDLGSKVMLIAQLDGEMTSTGSNIAMMEVSPSTTAWEGVPKLTTGVAETVDAPIHFVVARDCILCFSLDGNFVIENTNPPGLDLRWRSMGLAKPNVTRIINQTAASVLEGVYYYGVEVVSKKGGVAFTGSGVETRLGTSAGLNKGEKLREALTESFQPVIEVDISASIDKAPNMFIRLYRSKRTDDATTTDIAIGSEFELYLVQEMSFTDFLENGSEFLPDQVLDEELPLTELGSVVADFNVIGLEPIPPCSIGEFIGNRVCFTGAPSLQYGYGSVWFTPNDFSIYAESYLFTQQVQCLPGDGQKITNLCVLDQDLVVIKESKTGRIPRGDVLSTFQILDPSIGCPKEKWASVVGSFGIAARTNGNYDFMVFTRNLRWQTTIAGMEVCRPLRGFEPNQDFEKPQFADHDGKLYYAYGSRCFVLHYREGRGWTELVTRHGSSQYTMVDTIDGVLYMCVSPYDIPVNDEVYIIKQIDNEDQRGVDFNRYLLANTWVDWQIKTGPYMHDNGRSMIEQLYISVEAAVANRMSMSVFMVNRTQQVKENETFELIPDERAVGTLPPADSINEKTVVEFQYYANPNSNGRTRIYAERLFYKIHGYGDCFFYSPRFYGIRQVGTRPPSVSFKSTLNDLKVIQAVTTPDHWLTRTDMEVDIPQLPADGAEMVILSYIVEEQTGCSRIEEGDTVLKENNNQIPTAGNDIQSGGKLVILNGGNTEISIEDYQYREGITPNPWN